MPSTQKRPALISKASGIRTAHYSPPWADTRMIGVAGSSGSGKTSLAVAITTALNLPWVVILSIDSFYKELSPEQSQRASRNEFDFDSPEAIDFDLLVERLKDLREGRLAEIPIWSFHKHARLEKTHTIYSPHVIILEGIFALHDPRVLDLLDLKIFADADADLCLSRRLVRDVRERGRDIEGCIKQWFAFVKPNFHRYVETQKQIADIIVPRGIENKVAISMVTDHIRKTLQQKSKLHQIELNRLGKTAADVPLSENVRTVEQSRQIVGVNTIILDPKTEREDFIFYFDRIAATLLEKAVGEIPYEQKVVTTPAHRKYQGLGPKGVISAVALLRGGSILEPALKRVLPDCITGRILIQTSFRTGEPELHFRYLPSDIGTHARVLLLDPQMNSGGAALMAVKVLVDHGVKEDAVVFVTYFAGKKGLARLMAVFPDIRVVVCRIGEDLEERWIEAKYLGC